MLAEVQTAADGLWTLEPQSTLEWVVASSLGHRIGAVFARPGESRELQFPVQKNLQFEFPQAPQGAVIWIDPLELEGFPAELLSALRTHPDQVIDLHLRELTTTSVQRLNVQSGKYRISGGRVAIHPPLSADAESLVLGCLVDRETSTMLPAKNGEVIIEVQDARCYQASFVAQK